MLSTPCRSLDRRGTRSFDRLPNESRVKRPCNKRSSATAKARGVRLGTTGRQNLRATIDRLESEADAFAAKMRGVLLGLKARDLSQRAIARELNGLGIKSPRGLEWRLITVQRGPGP